LKWWKVSFVSFISTHYTVGYWHIQTLGPLPQILNISTLGLGLPCLLGNFCQCWEVLLSSCGCLSAWSRQNISQDDWALCELSSVASPRSQAKWTLPVCSGCYHWGKWS
jgi:hypothetical protein